MGAVTWSIAIDWQGNGNFTDTHDDVTTRTLERGSFTAEYGRDQARSLAPMAPGRGSLELDNTSRDYSPENLGSPLYGNVLPARPLRIQATQDAVTYTVFRGHTDDFEIRPARGDRSVAISALDPLAMLKDAELSTQVHQGIRTGDAIDLILDAIGWPSADRDLDPGATTIRWWWEEGADAFDAISKIVASEGPGAFVHADPDGAIVFRDRHHRLLDTASVTTQATFTADTAPKFTDLIYDHGWRDVINSVRISVEERDPSSELEPVWESADVRSIAASSTLTISIQTNDPVIDPEVSFTTLAGSVTPVITQTSGQALTLELTAGGSAAAVSELVVTARPITVVRTYQVYQEDATSISRYGLRSLTHEVPWAGVHDADAIAQLIIGARSERLPIVRITMTSSTTATSATLTQQLVRNLSDRVTVHEEETQVNADFYIDEIKHQAAQAGLVLTTEFGMERATVQAEDVFRFDDASHGFNDGVFGIVGLDDPANLFVFDASGHGFNDGVFAT